MVATDDSGEGGGGRPRLDDFPQRLRHAMAERGLSHRDLAVKADWQVSVRTLFRWTSGEAEPPASGIVALSRALGMSADRLLGLDDSAVADMPAPRPVAESASPVPPSLDTGHVAALAGHLAGAVDTLRLMMDATTSLPEPRPVPRAVAASPSPPDDVKGPPAPVRPNPKRTEPLLNRVQAARHLGMSARWVATQQRDHGLPHRKVGGVCLYYASELNEWVERRQADDERSGKSGT